MYATLQGLSDGELLSRTSVQHCFDINHMKGIYTLYLESRNAKSLAKDVNQALRLTSLQYRPICHAVVYVGLVR